MCFSSGGRKSRQDMLTAEQNSVARTQGTKEFIGGNRIRLQRDLPKMNAATEGWLRRRTKPSQSGTYAQGGQLGNPYASTGFEGYGPNPGFNINQLTNTSYSSGAGGGKPAPGAFKDRDKRFGLDETGAVTFLGQRVSKKGYGSLGRGGLQITKTARPKNEQQARKVFRTFGRDFDAEYGNSSEFYRAGTEGAPLQRTKVKDEASLRRRNRRARANQETAAGTRRIQKKRQANFRIGVGSQSNSGGSGVRIPT